MTSIDCDVLILAGGFGTRLQAVVSDVPKPMAPVNGRPFIEHVLDRLVAQGAKRIILSVGHMAELITRHFGDCYNGAEIVYAVENVPLGTGGAMAFAMGEVLSEDVIVLNGDTYLDCQYGDFIQACRAAEAVVGIVVRTVEDTERYGRCEIANGRLATFSEKGKSGLGLINAGVYYMQSDLFDAIQPQGQKFSFEQDYLSRYLIQLQPTGFLSDGYFIDIGIPDDYARAQNDFLAIFPSENIL